MAGSIYACIRLISIMNDSIETQINREIVRPTQSLVLHGIFSSSVLESVLESPRTLDNNNSIIRLTSTGSSSPECVFFGYLQWRIFQSWSGLYLGTCLAFVSIFSSWQSQAF